MKKKKIAIIGAGNAGCITAMHYYLCGRDIFDKILIYYDPSSPIERVGQGATLAIAELIYEVFNLNWYNQFEFIKSTRKDGILYENWGNKKEKFFHPFPLDSISLHYVPELLSKLILNCGFFEIIEKNIQNPEEEIDSDYILDCRGRHNRNPQLYDELINPLNSVILGKSNIPDPSLNYTRCVATPDGWTFVIPNYDGVSYGYLFNSKITNKNIATKNFSEIFNITPDIELQFQNYLAKSFFEGERTCLNGNRGSFLEPLEATSTTFYHYASKCFWDHIVDGVDKDICNRRIRKEMLRIQTFVLWHYQFGSKYNTPFWEYVKTLPFSIDDEFRLMVDSASKLDYIDAKNFQSSYSQWGVSNFKCWIDNVC
jgi:hypothetical protein